MATITSEIKEFVQKQKLCFVATVCPDGTPNLSPKGTTAVWDEDHLVFGDIRSPGTINNLLANPAIEINMVDVFTRKGYRFKGTATIISGGNLFEQVISFYGEMAQRYKIQRIVMVKVERVLPLWSPAYDIGYSEEDLLKMYKEYWFGMYGDK